MFGLLFYTILINKSDAVEIAKSSNANMLSLILVLLGLNPWLGLNLTLHFREIILIFLSNLLLHFTLRINQMFPCCCITLARLQGVKATLKFSPLC